MSYKEAILEKADTIVMEEWGDHIECGDLGLDVQDDIWREAVEIYESEVIEYALSRAEMMR